MNRFRNLRRRLSPVRAYRKLPKLWKILLPIPAVIFGEAVFGLWLGFVTGTILYLLVFAAVGGEMLLRYVRGTPDEARARGVKSARTARPIPTADLPQRVQDALLPERTQGKRTLEAEVVLIEYRKHPVVVMKWVLLAIALVPGLAVAMMHSQRHAGVIFLGWVAVECFVAYKIADWHNNRFYVTQFRIFNYYGVLTHHMPAAPLGRLTETDPSVSLIAQILFWLRLIDQPFGDYAVETAGQIEFLHNLGPIPNVLNVALLIAMHATRRAPAASSGDST